MRPIQFRIVMCVFLVSLVACETPKAPEFTTQVGLPLSNDLFTIADLQEELADKNDSLNLEIVQDSVVLVISDREAFGVSDDLAEDPIVDSTTAVFNNNIRLRDSSTATYRLGTLAPTSVDTLHGKTNRVIPAFTISTVQQNLTFGSFSSMTVDSGSMRVVVTNNTQTRDSLHVTVYRSNNVRIDSFYTGPLTTGQAVTRLVPTPFSGGSSITTPILVRVRGGSTGSSGASVPLVDTSLSVTVRVVFDVKNSSVTGTFPAQTLARSDSVKSSSNSVLDTGYVSRGKMYMKYTNINLPVASTVTFISNDFIDPAGNPLSRTKNLPAGNGQIVQDTVNLSGWQLRPKSLIPQTLSIGNQHFLYSYDVVTSSATSSQTVANGAGVKANVTLDTLYFSRVTGLITQETVNLDERSEDINIDQIDTINLSQAYFEVYTEHRIPFPVSLDISISGRSKSGTIRTTTLQGDLTKYTGTPGGAPQRDTLRTPVAKYGEVAGVLSLLPDSIKLSGSAVVGDNLSKGAVIGTDSLSFRVFLRAPLVFSLPNAPTRNFIRTKPNELAIDEKIEDLLREDVKRLHITGQVTNSFPVPISVRFLVNNIAQEDSFYTFLTPDTTFLFPDTGALVIDKAPTGANGMVTQPRLVDLDFLIPDSAFTNMFRTMRFDKKYRGLQVQLLSTGGTVRVSAADFARVVSSIQVELLVDESLTD